MKKDPTFGEGSLFIQTSRDQQVFFGRLKDLVVEASGRIAIVEIIATMAQLQGMISVIDEDTMDYMDVIRGNFVIGEATAREKQ